MSKITSSTLDYAQLSQLRPGETMTIGTVQIKRAGIMIVVYSNGTRRSFEKVHLALEWINSELAASPLKKGKVAEAVIAEKSGRQRAIEVETTKLTKKVTKAEKKAVKAVAAKPVAKAKTADRKARKQRGKVRRVLEGIVFTLVWLLFLVGGAIVFQIHLAPWMPAEVGTAIEGVKDLLLSLTTDVKLINAVAIGGGVLAALILLTTTISLQLHKTKGAKAWGLITSIITIGGVGYLAFVNFDSLIAIANNPSRTLIAQVAVLGLAVIQLIIVLAVGWKKAE